MKRLVQEIPYQNIISSSPKIAGGKEYYSCPLHIETKNSFVVYPGRDWYCFGCSAHGQDIIDLIALMNDVDRKEAFKLFIEKIKEFND